MAIDQLEMSFESSAEWRREKAAEYPQQAESNLAAAACLDRLAATCKDVSQKWVKAYEKLWDSEDAHSAQEKEQEMIGYIGIEYENAEAFVKDLVSRFEPD
jgi:hypothetical protein